MTRGLERWHGGHDQKSSPEGAAAPLAQDAAQPGSPIRASVARIGVGKRSPGSDGKQNQSPSGTTGFSPQTLQHSVACKPLSCHHEEPFRATRDLLFAGGGRTVPRHAFQSLLKNSGPIGGRHSSRGRLRNSAPCSVGGTCCKNPSAEGTVYLSPARSRRRSAGYRCEKFSQPRSGGRVLTHMPKAGSTRAISGSPDLKITLFHSHRSCILRQSFRAPAARISAVSRIGCDPLARFLVQ